jgi:hypothetical protein
LGSINSAGLRRGVRPAGFVAAALETLDRVLSADTEAEALLLFEDSDIMRRRVIVDERVDLISTGDFLRELEAAHLIQSTDRILDVAAEAGRNIQRQREPTSDESVRRALREQLRKTEEGYAKYAAQKQDDPAPPKDPLI